MKGDVLSGSTVLRIITRLDRGGSARVVLDLTKELSEDGVHGVIITGKTVEPETDLEAYAAGHNIDLYHVPQLVREISPLRDISAFFTIRRIIRQVKPDIVHTHTSKAGIIGRFAAWSAGVRHIVHTPHGHIFYGYFNSFVSSVFIMIERLASRITNKITVLTGKGLSAHVRMGIDSEDKFTVIHSGVDVSRYSNGDGDSIRSETGYTGKVIVGWAGRLVPIKNCSLFIESASLIKKRNPDTRFIVAGDGEERELIERLAEKLNLSGSLTFLEDCKDMPSVMAAFDVFVLSSHNEGFGRVLVEAMASGAVVVSTHVGGTPDVIEDGVSGMLVPPGNPSAMADAVCKVLDDDELRVRLVKAGKARAGLFDIRSMVDKFEELYAEILGL